MPDVLLPMAFVSANLILYWGGYDYTWKLAVALVVGLLIFGIGSSIKGTGASACCEPAIWIGPWIIGSVIIGLAGRYGDGSKSWLPEWIDLMVVIAFSLVIFYWAVNTTQTQDMVDAAVAKDAAQLDYEHEHLAGA